LLEEEEEFRKWEGTKWLVMGSLKPMRSVVVWKVSKGSGLSEDIGMSNSEPASNICTTKSEIMKHLVRVALINIKVG
jgi:hypothetical protein